MASPNENDQILMHRVSDSPPRTRASTSRSRSVPLSKHSDEIVEDLSVVLGHAGSLQYQRRPPLVPMGAGPTSSTRRRERLFFAPAPSPTHRSSFATPGENNEEFVRKQATLLRSGKLGICNERYCTTCPSHYSIQGSQRVTPTFRNALYDETKGWARRFGSSLERYLPTVMNPHSKAVQWWAKLFALSSLVAIFIDPFFFFLTFTTQSGNCIMTDWSDVPGIVSVRTLMDLIFLANILLQFRLAYVARESTVVGAGQLVDRPRKVALHYFRGYFFLDLFLVLPLPQILVLLVAKTHLSTLGITTGENLLRAAVLVQYIPKLCRLLPLLAGQTPESFIFKSAWANFVINLLTYMLAGHVVGSFWYNFGVQKVHQCLRNACRKKSSEDECRALIDCGPASSWRNNTLANACFQEGGYPYGIYLKAVNLSSRSNIVIRWSYSLLWGFQEELLCVDLRPSRFSLWLSMFFAFLLSSQISTLAGNQVLGYDVVEIFFTMVLIGLGLLLLALLIGNMQHFLDALGKRRLEKTLRRSDVERWMRYRRLPEDLRKRVRETERFNWVATRGVNEDLLFECMSDDLQRDIRRHLFIFLNKVRIFSVMDEFILDSIRERLTHRTYIRGSTIMRRWGFVEKMVFIVRGEMESIGEDGSVLPLAEGDVCGEELLICCLERLDVNLDGTTRTRGLLSNRNVRCVTNVDVFLLSVADLEDVKSLFSRFLRSPRVQGSIRYGSPICRLQAASQIQVAWRCRQRRVQKL